MCEPVTAALGAMKASTLFSVASAGLSIIGGIQAKNTADAQAQAAINQANFDAGVQRFNARQAENEAIQERAKGTEEELEKRRQIAETMSTQRVQLAAQGVDVTFGTAQDLQEDTLMLGEIDAQNIRTNVDRRVQALQDQSTLLLQQADATVLAGQNRASALKSQGSQALLQGIGAAATTAFNSKWFSADSAAKVVNTPSNPFATIHGR